MKIIIVNYRYFISGGPERYLFNIKELLERNGHTVIPFSIKSNHNQPTEYEEDFMSPIGEGKEVYFREYNKFDIKSMIKSFSRMFYSFEAKRKLDALIRKTKPDLVYVLHYQNKMSASIFSAVLKNKIPVIHRVSDFGQICANGIFYRASKKDICERCLTGSKFNAVRYKCVHHSYILSAVKASSLQLQKMLGITKRINAFVVPSKFTISRLNLFGIPAGKLHHIPTFFNFKTIDPLTEISYEPFALFVGRVEEEKGLLTLVKAFEGSGYTLKIVGSSSSGYDKVLKQYLEGKEHNIEFLGQKNFQEIQAYLKTCAFTVMPAEIYDNFPNTVLESFAFKKAVLATNVGSLREIVTDNETGVLFPLRDVAALRQKIDYLFRDKQKCIELGENAFKKLTSEYSAENHYHKLMQLFEATVGNRTDVGTNKIVQDLVQVS
ncbi:MAG TPA: glycosyltransferase family 4 protein [Chitinophagaceae bacterium]|nr:glycosyltransferase family 4 protein [Chitinophagaceae bacterium]